MLKIINAIPQEFGEAIKIPQSSASIANDILQNGTVYCIKHCLRQEPIDAIRQDVFDYYARIPQVHLESWEIGTQSYHRIRRGVSAKQKTIHYFHEYGFNSFQDLSIEIRKPLEKLFESLSRFYQELTLVDTKFDHDSSDYARLRPAFMHYFAGGGMFTAHSHNLEPQKIGLILGISKCGRDYFEGGTGFEMPNGEIIDTSDVHDIGDILLFRYDLKHWVTPCDIHHPLDEKSSAGRWNALIPRY